jgi:hypothetical protein
MISGHCLEGCLAGAWLAWCLQFDSQGLDHLDWRRVHKALQQWSVDIGDRRVMAQVHYPSDNIGSWWVGAQLPHPPRSERLENRRVDAGIPEERRYAAASVYQVLKSQPFVPAALWPALTQIVEES